MMWAQIPTKSVDYPRMQFSEVDNFCNYFYELFFPYVSELFIFHYSVNNIFLKKITQTHPLSNGKPLLTQFSVELLYVLHL